MSLAAWQIENGAPARLAAGAIDLEKHLEAWIEQDVTLIDSGLLVIQRQLGVDGGVLDLLCVDPQGRATVVEIKRGKLMREAIAQGLDYAGCVSNMSVEALRTHVEDYLHRLPSHPGLDVLLDPNADGQREVAVIVVGVGKDPGLHRMIDFLGETYNFPIRAVTFDVFNVAEARQIIVREETDPEPTAAPTHVAGPPAAGVIDAVGGPDSPMGRQMQILIDAAARNGLYARPYKWSVMLTPPQNKSRYLMVFGRWSGKLQISHGAEAFAEFFPVDAPTVEAALGPSDVHSEITSDNAALEWGGRLDQLFATIAASAAAAR